MKNGPKILCVFLSAWAMTSHADIKIGDFQITVKVVDENGKPMPKVNVGTAFVQANSLIPLTGRDLAKKQIDTLTGTNGEVVIQSSSVADNYIYSGLKPVAGYYSSGIKEYRFQKIENGQWQPWNPTIKFVLKPIGVRVPMYAKKIPWSTLPENSKPIGYDLELGDWVAPYGKGISTDFIFSLERDFTSVTQDFNATLTLTFHNDGDGIQSVMSDTSGSTFRIPRSAPEGGYESKLALKMYRVGEKPMVGVLANPDQNYFFRVRTKRDQQGNIVSARYGKIYGGIGWDIFHSSTAQLQFTYYLNSKINSRNLEFDPTQNMFKNLPSFERVPAP
jgi:hypothetical protein